jgi:hypothetical protein
MKKLLLIVLSAATLISCKKDVDELPPTSETGTNTFGVKINNVMWAPQGFGITPTAPLLEGRFADGGASIVINARNFGSSPDETEFEIYVKDAALAGVYLLNQHSQRYPLQTASYGYHIKRRFTPEAEYITGSLHNGRVEFTKIDRVNNIIAGSFSFTAANTTDPAAPPITVTEGRFDIKVQ